MTTTEMFRRAGAEFLGTGLLVTVVVGSGIAASDLSADPGLQLLENSIATTFGLAVLILMLGPVSGAHFNPAVSMVDAALGRRRGSGLSALMLGVYLLAQVAGGIGGTLLASVMFAIPAAVSTTERATPGTVLGEVVATAGLILLIVALARTEQPTAVVAAAVGAYIGAAYWFTSSTSFANPAVTIARVFTDTSAGIAPASVLPFLAAQLTGAAIGAGVAVLLFPQATAAAVDIVVPQTLVPRTSSKPEEERP